VDGPLVAEQRGQRAVLADPGAACEIDRPVAVEVAGGDREPELIGAERPVEGGDRCVGEEAAGEARVDQHRAVVRLGRGVGASGAGREVGVAVAVEIGDDHGAAELVLAGEPGDHLGRLGIEAIGAAAVDVNSA